MGAGGHVLGNHLNFALWLCAGVICWVGEQALSAGFVQ